MKRYKTYKPLVGTLFLLCLSSSPASEGITDELIRLKNSLKEEQQKAIKPINRKYLNALVSLKDKYMERKNLQGALAVEKEIKASALIMGVLNTERLEVIKDGDMLVWVPDADMQTALLTFEKDKNITSTDKGWSKGNWKWSSEKPGEITFYDKRNGKVFKFTQAKGKPHFRGKNPTGGKGVTVYIVKQ